MWISGRVGMNGDIAGRNRLVLGMNSPPWLVVEEDGLRYRSIS